MTDLENDLALFERLKKGDRLALNALFEKYYSAVCRFAYTYLRNTNDAEEIVSDVFFGFWKNRDELMIESNFRAYLYVSVRRACLRQLQKVKAITESLEAADAVHATDGQTPEDALASTELEQEIQTAIGKLPAGCQRIFVMSRFEGLSYAEIAAILSVSPKTVENQIVRALSLLRQSLYSAIRSGC